MNTFLPSRASARHFCPSCHQKRVVEFGEWLCEEGLKAVPHRHFTFRMAKILKRYFLYDRRLPSELSRCARDALKVTFQTIIPEEDAVPGAVIAIQTFGDFLEHNHHCHVLCTVGAFYGKGMFRVAPRSILKDLEKLEKTGPLEINKAEERILKGIQICKALRIKAYYSLGHLYLGELYLNGGEKKKSMENLKKAEGMFREMGMDHWLGKAQEVSARL